MRIEIRLDSDEPGGVRFPNGSSPMGRGTLLSLAVLFEGGMLLLAWALARALGIPLEDRLGPVAGQVVLGLGATLPPLAALAWAVRSRIRLLRRLKAGVDELIDRALLNATTADLVLIALLAGLGEEALFRGVLQPLVGNVFGPWAGLAATAVAFGLAHPISLVYVLYATVMGLYLGALVELGGGLLAAVVTHAAYDLAALLWLVARRRRELAAADDNPSSAG